MDKLLDYGQDFEWNEVTDWVFEESAVSATIDYLTEIKTVYFTKDDMPHARVTATSALLPGHFLLLLGTTFSSVVGTTVLRGANDGEDYPATIKLKDVKVEKIIVHQDANSAPKTPIIIFSGIIAETGQVF